MDTDSIVLHDSFEVEVEAGYEHLFTQEFASGFRKCSSSTISRSEKLGLTGIENRKYTAKIFKLGWSIIPEDCVEYLKNQGAIFFGLFGLALLWLTTEKLPGNSITISPRDDKEIEFSISEKTGKWRLFSDEYTDSEVIWGRSHWDQTDNNYLVCFFKTE